MSAHRAVNSSQVVNIEDLRHLAQRRVPRSVFDYLDGGAEAELTLAENCRAFRDVLFRPRGAMAVGDCDLKTRVLSHELSFPALLERKAHGSVRESSSRNRRPPLRREDETVHREK